MVEGARETPLVVLPRFLDKSFKNAWKPDVSNDDYHRLNEYMGSSGLKLLLRSPKHFYWRYGLGNIESETPAMRIGKLVHAAILEPERYSKNLRVQPAFDKRTNAGKAAHADWMGARGPQDVIVSQEDHDIILNVIEEVNNHPVARGILLGGEREYSGFFREPKTGMASKIRPDLMLRDQGMILDVKTTTDARKSAVTHQIAKYRYDLSAAFYLMGAAQIDQEIPWNQFYLLFVEKTKPFVSNLFRLDNAALETGEIAMRKAISTYAQCVSLNKWAGYSEAADWVSVPDYILKSSEMDYDEQQAEDENNA